jgi:hypothetical protein
LFNWSADPSFSSDAQDQAKSIIQDTLLFNWLAYSENTTIEETDRGAVKSIIQKTHLFRKRPGSIASQYT